METLAKLKPRSNRKNPQLDSATSKDDILNAMENYGASDGAGSNKENNNNSEQMSRGSSLDGKWEMVDPDYGSPAASLSHSYSLEWEKLFTQAEMMRKLKVRASEGKLRSSRFRSVVWKLFLEVLPADMGQWVEKTRVSRAKFEELKNKLIVNPRKAVDSVNLSLHNPLSQDEESPWNKFFQDNELRLTIKQDVIRTFPEVEFFRSTDMGAMMIDILFCYSREHATSSYKQGMHELLAPLIFVLHCDHQAFLHACEIESVLEVMKEVMDPAYLEHDAYSMFCQVMETVEPWYLSRDYSFAKGGSLRSLEIINATPFSRSQDLNPSNAIVTKLTRIQDYILKKYDQELHQHLERLEIAPQIYGIRWLRLLFGREFPMQDLLMLWDAIFADGIGFDLVDYVFVAMLLYLRDILLSCDYATCLTALMKYPPVPDVHYFVDKALWLREPNQNPRPPNYTHVGGIRTSSSMGSGDNMSSGASSSCRDNARDHSTDPIGSTVSLSQVEESMFRHAPSASSMAKLETSNLRSAQSSPGIHHSNVFPLTPEDPSVTGSPTKSQTLLGRAKPKQKKMTKVERELQEQVTHLQGELNDKATMCRYCASKLDVHIGRLQQDLSKQNLDVDDEVMVSLAGLKLVRDVLNGTLKFSQTIADDEEININEDFYSSQDDEVSAYGSEQRRDDNSTGVTSPESDIQLETENRRVPARQRALLRNRSSEDTSTDSGTPGDVHGPDMPPHGAAEREVKGNSAVELWDYHVNADSLDKMVNADSLDKMGAGALKSAEGSSSFGGDEALDGGAVNTNTNATSSNPFTSKIRSMFKSVDPKEQQQMQQRQKLLLQQQLQQQQQQQTQAYEVLPGSRKSSDYPSSTRVESDDFDRVPGRHRRSSREEQAEKELGSMDSRRRAKSNVDMPSRTYWPDFATSSGQERRPVEQLEGRGDRRGSGQGDRRLREGRERSKSQPSKSLFGAEGQGEGINPLYKLKYDQGMEY
ncbi:TBC1 domain family member 5 isoform X2 [Aplysia californica]|uniref:TBC1 domain family member 5 isoform X2 n=1 Tax=Aplysia californica TaxID=6500 RepID=A0ABM0K074_APLCA|nr:TBC1 domain family member 5 isoform X2 [Aplysia californica]